MDLRIAHNCGPLAFQAHLYLKQHRPRVLLGRCLPMGITGSLVEAAWLESGLQLWATSSQLPATLGHHCLLFWATWLSRKLASMHSQNSEGNCLQPNSNVCLHFEVPGHKDGLWLRIEVRVRAPVPRLGWGSLSRG